MKTMKYTVKNVKSFLGREGMGYSCSLYKDGKKIGTVTETADGGDVDLYLDSKELEQELIDYAGTFTFPSYDGTEQYPQTPQIFLEGLVSEYETAKMCKNKWVYTFKGEPHKLFHFSKDLDKAKIELMYASRIESCLNDVVAV